MNTRRSFDGGLTGFISFVQWMGTIETAVENLSLEKVRNSFREFRHRREGIFLSQIIMICLFFLAQSVRIRWENIGGFEFVLANEFGTEFYLFPLRSLQ